MVNPLDLIENEHIGDGLKFIAATVVQRVAKSTTEGCCRFLCGQIFSFGFSHMHFGIKTFAFCNNSIGFQSFGIF